MPGPSLTGRASHVLQHLGALVFPPSCVLCGRLTEPSAALVCPTCYDGLVADRNRSCPRCAATVGSHGEVAAGCLWCRRRRYAFASAYRLGEYRDALRQAVLIAKTPRGETMARTLGRFTAHRLSDVADRAAWQMIVPAPMHWWRRSLVTFNHAQVLAEEIGRGLHVPVQQRILRAVMDRPPQTQMSMSQRFQNVRGAFAAAAVRKLRQAIVLVVDDVMTTGATADEAARCLRQAGARRVDVAVVGRAAYRA